MTLSPMPTTIPSPHLHVHEVVYYEEATLPSRIGRATEVR